jgi:hypothetical protein
MATPEGMTPAKSVDHIQCATCDNLVDTPEEIASYPDGRCPKCFYPWTGVERRDTYITVATLSPIGTKVM